MEMDIVIKIIGVIFILLGAGILLKPQILKKLMNFMKKGKRIYLAGTVRFVIGIIFLLGASAARNETVIAVIGILFLLGGLLIFVLGPDRIRRTLEFYSRQPDLLFRFISLIPIAIGGLVIYAA
jgi:uncharacterized protein YjeT (DUF2065 family)